MYKGVNFTAHEAACTARHTFDIYSRAENQGEVRRGTEGGRENAAVAREKEKMQELTESDWVHGSESGGGWGEGGGRQERGYSDGHYRQGGKSSDHVRACITRS